MDLRLDQTAHDRAGSGLLRVGVLAPEGGEGMGCTVDPGGDFGHPGFGKPDRLVERKFHGNCIRSFPGR